MMLPSSSFIINKQSLIDFLILTLIILQAAINCDWSSFVKFTPSTKDLEAVTVNGVAPNTSYIEKMFMDDFTMFLEKTDHFWEDGAIK